MLINSDEILEKAQNNKYCIPHFNINNLEWTRFVLEACEEMKSPVILGVSEGAAKYMGGYKNITDMVINLQDYLKITVPVVLHLDHGTSVETCKEAIDAGFSSVMFDGSKFDLDDNIRQTKEVVDYAKLKNVSVEAEVGCIGGEEDGISNESKYTNVEDAKKLVLETGVNSLAAAVGSAHGMYKEEPKLDFLRIEQLKETLNIPLVLHGGSWIADTEIQKAINCGICKININTELQLAWSTEVRKYLLENEKEYDPRRIIKSGEFSLKNVVIEKIKLLGSINKI